MTFLIHYIVRTPAVPLHFNLCVAPDLVTVKRLLELTYVLADDANNRLPGRTVDTDDIVIANIIPIPTGDPAVQQIGGS